MRRICQTAILSFVSILVGGVGSGCAKKQPARSDDGEPAMAATTQAVMHPPQTMRPKTMRPKAPPRPVVVDPDPPASVLPKAAQLPADAEALLKKKHLLSFPSRFNGKVHVKQKGRVRSLYLGRRMDIVHTRLNLDRPADLISPYQQCLLLGFGLFDRPRDQVKRVAMIGLGGGAITRFFQLKRPNLVFHSVEIDPMVVAVARRFFGVLDTPGYRSYAMDGRRFIAEAKRPYDVIILDAFDAEANLPKPLASQEFFQLLRRHLSPKGVLITNILVYNRRIYATLLKTMQTVFPKVLRIPLRSFRTHNTLLLAPKDPGQVADLKKLAGRIAQLKASFSVSFPLDRCLKVANTDKVNLDGAKVIRDKKSPAPMTAKPR